MERKLRQFTYLFLGFSLAACASISSGEKKMKEIKFAVSFEPHLGLNFQNQSEQFIPPEFANDADAYTASREWQRGIDEGYFEKGLSLFCQCEGQYVLRSGRKVFQVNKAKYYFIKFTNWNEI
jgi:hypothetical protein